jgi:hypothetical protein
MPRSVSPRFFTGQHLNGPDTLSQVAEYHAPLGPN